jgi:hypothetical protein
MMKNPQVKGSAQRQIDNSVSRLLSDLKGLEPPLDLKEVRSTLELDLEFYSGKDPSHLRQLIHTIKIAGHDKLEYAKKQLGWIIQKLGLKGLMFWDDNRILIDQDLHAIKLRWAECHEVGHKICPWHRHYLLGDSENELSPNCHAKIEAEANYASGQILFMQNRFVEELMSKPMKLSSLESHTKTFGNSKASTLWRMVEDYKGVQAVVGIVSEHPHHLPEGFDHLAPCRYVIQSDSFRQQFSNLTEAQLFNVLKGYCSFKQGGHLGTEEVRLLDDNGETHEFVFESFCYRFKIPGSETGEKGNQVLTLGIQRQRLTSLTLPVSSGKLAAPSRLILP